MTLHKKPRTKQPRIAVREKDFQRLSNLAEVAVTVMPEVAHFLEHELSRARIVSGNAASLRVVGMGSKVKYLDESTGREHLVTLVYPAESDIERGLISVLTPIGAALLGLSQGQSIHWTTRSGEAKQLTVTSIFNKVALENSHA